MSDTMRRSWLVQRLNQPTPGTSLLSRVADSLAFGGGLRNGGLSDEAMGLLRSVFSFDYMGAAEFEFGAVPEALNSIAKDHNLLIWRRIDVDLATLAEDYRDKTKHTGEASVWIIAREAEMDEAEARIRSWASDGYRARLKESTRLEASLRPSRDEYTRTDGWLELDNGFFFFTDLAMFEGVADLFGVVTEAVSS